MKIVIPEAVKEFTRIQCNGEEAYTNDKIVDKILSYCSSPKTVLEIGCGIGRGSVLLDKKLHTKPKFYLLDGDKNERGQICGVNWNSRTDFYNSLVATRTFCEANGLSDFVLLDAEKDWQRDLPKFDLIFSLKSIGFHWPIDLYLSQLLPYVAEKTILAFELRWLNLSKGNEEQLLEWGEWNFQQLKCISLNHYTIVGCDLCTNSLLVLRGADDV